MKKKQKAKNFMGWGLGDKVKNITNGKLGKITRLDSKTALVEYDDGTRENEELGILEVTEYAR